MNRRDFMKAGGATLTASAALAQSDAASVPTLYYVDGYHGGVRGHMPPGCWRDILNTMRELPHWKLCFDVEPASWDFLRREDPQAYREVREHLTAQALDARVEMVNGTFAQPFGWANGGESNIRQLLRGREVILRHFPNVVLETYAVQEPCWASCLPQILKSLGFKGAVLKNPSTAWGGYSAGFDAEIVDWVGPDGTSIPTVPRYACENLQKVWETESVSATPEFARKCVANGIPRPSGMCYQDLGWSAKPKVSGDHIQYVTWREYMNRIAAPPAKQWRFSIEDILVTLPWGEKTLQAAAQHVRSAENRLLAAEKIAALAWLERRHPWKSARLRDAWDQLLWAQHHDAWITVTTRAGRRAWAFQVAAQTLDAEETASDLIAEAAEALATSGDVAVSRPLGPQFVSVLNTMAAERRDLVEFTLATDRGTTGVRVIDSAGREVPSQVIPTRRYLSRDLRSELSRRGMVAPAARTEPAGQTINTANVVFRADTPSLGHATFRVEPLYSAPSRSSTSTVSARAASDGVVDLESDFYRLRIDPAKGGALTSVFDKRLNREFCDHRSERLFNEYRGYFVTEEKWRSSAEQSARVSIVENGPVRARVRVAGRVGAVPYQTTITLVEGQKRIEFQTRFTYEQDTWIGDPWDIKPEARRTEPRRSHHDGRYKLQAFFPVALNNPAIYKNAAYDVCRSRNQDTWFQRWDEIKHNIVLNWVDVVDEQEKIGLAVLSDHTTAYTHGPGHPLALVMGWGWEGGFWFGKCPLKGTQQISYALVPHAGLWDQAGISDENNRWIEPLTPQIVSGNYAKTPEPKSFISVSGGGVEVPAVLVEENSVLLRLFNAEGEDSERTVTLQFSPRRVTLVELDGRVVRDLPLSRAPGGGRSFRLSVPRFGIRTVRCDMDGGG